MQSNKPVLQHSNDIINLHCRNRINYYIPHHPTITLNSPLPSSLNVPSHSIPIFWLLWSNILPSSTWNPAELLWEPATTCGLCQVTGTTPMTIRRRSMLSWIRTYKILAVCVMFLEHLHLVSNANIPMLIFIYAWIFCIPRPFFYLNMFKPNMPKVRRLKPNTHLY